MANRKTITATTTESYVEFPATYSFMWFMNYGENDCYISDHSGIVAGADDVILLKAGEARRLGLPQCPAVSKAYIKSASGSNTVEVHAQNFSDCPFKKKAKGGEQITVESLTATENTTYTAPTGTAYNPVIVNVPAPEPTIEPITIYNDGTYTAPAGVDGYSPVIVNTAPQLPTGYTQLEYVVCPSNSNACGFEIPNYLVNVKDLHECVTSPLSLSSEMGFAGYTDYYEIYYTADSELKTYQVNSMIDTQSNVVIGNKYISRFFPSYSGGNTPYAIGYYRVNNYIFYGRIYYYKIWRLSDTNVDGLNSTLIHDFVPAKRNSDNKIGLYDLVNNVFCTSTTGTDFGEPA